MQRKIRWIIKYMFIVFLSITLRLFCWAQETPISDQEICILKKPELVWNTEYLLGENTNLIPSELLSGSNVNYTLSKNAKIFTNQNSESFSFTMEQPGIYELQTTISYETCKWVLNTPLMVYSNVINIIGTVDTKLLVPYNKIFAQQTTLINSIPLPTEGFYKTLVQHVEKIKHSDTIIISSNAIDQVLEGLEQLWVSSDLDLRTKTITIVNTMNRNLMKRIVSKYSKSLDSKRIYTTDRQNFLNLIASLSNKEDIIQNEYSTLFSLSEEEVPSYLFLSKMVDKLIYHGFPIDLISLLLTISLAVLTVTIFRQVIGFDIFWSYTPLMAWLSIYILGLPLSVVLFFFAFIATILVRLFTKKVYLLYSAKISLLISLYFLSIFVGLSFFPILLSDTISFLIFSNAFVIFPMLLIILVSEKLFYEWFNITGSGWRFSIVEFVVVSYVVYLIINSVNVQNFMLSYPESIILVIIFIILAGRFSGLQLLEYFRFYSLFKKYNNQDEEE